MMSIKVKKILIENIEFDLHLYKHLPCSEMVIEDTENDLKKILFKLVG